jgi:uncharacterized protein
VHKFWGWLGLNLGRHWIIALLIGAVTTVGLGFGATKLEFSTGQENYLNKSDPVYKDSVAYQTTFGGQAVIALVTMDAGHKVDELFTAANIAQWKAAEREIRNSHRVLGVVSPLTTLEWNDALVRSPNGDPRSGVAGKIILGELERDASAKGKEARFADAAVTLKRVTAIPVARRTIDNPAYLDVLLHDNTGAIRKPLLAVFPDDHHAQMVVRTLGNQSIEDAGAAADFVETAVASHMHFAHAHIVTTGAVELLQNINDYLTGGMALLGGIAILVMALILLLLFDVRWRLLPLGVVIVGVVWAFGVAGYVGIPLTIVTIAGLPVMLGIGIDYVIQMHARIEEEVLFSRAAHPIQETASNLGPALLVVTFDAVFAFAALHFSKVPMLRDFGLLLAVGVAAICLNSIVAPLAILGVREFRSPTTKHEFREGALGRLTVRLGSLPYRIAPPVAIASLAIFTAGILVEGKLVLQTDPIQWANQKSRVIKDLDILDRETGSSSELGLYVQAADVFTDATTRWVDGFTRDQLRQNEGELLTASALVATVSDFGDVPGAPHVIPSGEEVRAAYAVAPRDLQRSLVSANGDAANIVFRTGPSSLEARAKVVREIRKTVVAAPGIRATPSGLAVVGVGLLDNLLANRILLTYLSILFVFLFLSVRLRSVVRALLSLVPVLIAVGAASLFAYALSLKLSPMTAVGGPLVVAACTEFTSLILLRYVEERRRALEPRAAMDVVSARTGRAFIVSALTAVSGVAVIATSSLPLLRGFGELVALNLAVALLSALVVLPPLLVWADRRNWVSRGLVPPELLIASRSRTDTQSSGDAAPTD